METHIGVGVGQYIEKEFANAKESLWIACPTLTISITKKILSIAKKGIKVEFQEIGGANHFFSNREKELSFVLDKYIKKESALY